MNDIVHKLQSLRRAEITILRIHLRTAARQAVYYAVGIVLILLAVAMLNVALYVALSDELGSSMGALIVSAVNGLLAMGILVMASLAKPGPEATHAEEVRDLVIQGIHDDAQKLSNSLDEVKFSLKRIHTGLNGLMGGGGSMLGLLHLGPLLDLLISSLSKSDKAS